MIARRSFQAEQVAIEHIDREITIAPSISQDKAISPTTPAHPSSIYPASPPRDRAPCRGEPGFEEPPNSSTEITAGIEHKPCVKWKGEDAKEEMERKERRNSAQGMIAREKRDSSASASASAIGGLAKERKDSAQEVMAKEEEIGKRNMMERLKDIVEVRKEEVRRKRSG